MRPGKYPFVWLLIPFSLGIGAGYLCTEYLSVSVTGVWVFAFISAVALSFYYHLRKKYVQRWLPGVAIALLLFGFGGFSVQKAIRNICYDWADKPWVYEALLLSEPKEQARSFLYEAQIIRSRSPQGSLENNLPVQQKVLLYFPKKATTPPLSKGALVYIRSVISSPRNKGNPEEFDYRAFLLRKGISGTGYVTDFHLGKQMIARKSVRDYAQSARQKLLYIYRQSGITDEAYGILSALTLGSRENLTEETRVSFSHAGISHVLAVSGLHVGFVYILLELLLGFMMPRKWIVPRQLSVAVLLWGFAFLTGLLPPVVRATLMCSLVALARIRRSRSISLNTLGAAAFLMLCFRPLLLFDLSFQLSFSAVAGILLWQPWLFRLLPCRVQVFRYAWGIIAVSLAAQLAVLPFILYYFSSFPCYFLLTNVAAITLVSVIIYTAFLLLLLTPFPWIQQHVSWLLQEEIHWLRYIVEGVTQLPGSHFTHLYVPFWEAVWIAFCVVGGMWYFTSGGKARKAVLVLCAGICGILGSELYKSYERSQPPKLVFYANSDCPAVHLIANRERTYLWGDTASSGYSPFVKYASGYWDKLGLSGSPLSISFSREVPFSANGLSFDAERGILRFQGTTICRVYDRRWTDATALQPLPVNYLWVSKGYESDIRSLQSLFSIHEVVIDASVPSWQRDRLEKECERLKLPCVNIREHGAYLVRN